MMKTVKRHEFKMDGLTIPFSINESTKAKHIRLVIDKDGLRVVKPTREKNFDVQSLLISKKDWIKKYYQEYLKRESDSIDSTQRRWYNGETLFYLGEEYGVNLSTHKEATVTVGFTNNRFQISVNERLTGDERDIFVESGLAKWYKRVARGILNQRIFYFTNLTGLKFKSMRLKDQKTRWGSCSGKGNLNFNWRLAMAPMWVIDYVVLHEVCHLKHLNHSKDFWSMVGSYMPDYENAKEWLKKNGRTLM